MGRSGEKWETVGISHNLPNKPRGTVGGYLGSYLNLVDEKGRVTLPAAFRKGAQAGASFVLIHAHKSEALTLYPDLTGATSRNGCVTSPSAIQKNDTPC